MLAKELNKKTSIKTLPRHLWINDPEIAKLRRSLLTYFIKTSIIFWIVILLVALIFLGSGEDPVWHTKSLDVFVTNFDNGLAGSFFIEAFRETPSGNKTLNWIFQTSDPGTIVEQIENGKAWASVYMNPGISDRFNQILQSILNGNPSNSSDLPSTATTIVYDQGRNFNTVNGYVLPPIRAAIAVASARYSAYLRSQVVGHSNATLSNVIAAISFANITNSPINYTDLDLHPAFPYASFLATSLGYLFLWLIMSTLVGASVRISQPLAGKIKIIDIAFIRLFSSIFNALIVSLIYSLCVLWFASFTRPVPFIRFWLFNWLAAITFIYMINLFVINLGALAQICLTLFIITNLATASSNVAIELQNRFYRIGYGLPLYHAFSAGRHFLFGSHTRLHIDIAVFFIYAIAAFMLAFATGLYRMRKQEALIIEKNRQNALNKRTTTQNVTTKTTQNITTKKR